MTDPRVSRAHTKLLRLVGREGPRTSFTVSARDAERFAIAAGAEDPVYFEDAAARAAGFSGTVGHPLLLSSMWEWGAGVPLRSFRPDGSGAQRDAWLPLDGLRLVGGGQELQFHAPVRPGAEVVATRTLEGVDLKDGRSGALLLIFLRSEFFTLDGDRLVSCRETFIGR
jgi:acyl dehydratase